MNLYIKKPFQGKQPVAWQKIVSGIILLMLLILVLNIFQAPIKNSFYTITSPFLKPLSQTGNSTSGFFSILLNGRGISQENSNLKEENQKLLSQIAGLQETISIDRSIQEVIQNTQTDNFSLTAVQVLGLDIPKDTILINKGREDGISENMPIISSTKVLVARVSKVYKNFSQGMLISSKDSVVDVKIQQSDSSLPPIMGAAKGSGNLSVYLDLVASDAQLNTSDTLVSSGQEGIFPKDLLIGKIISSSKNDLKPFQTANIQPFFEAKTTTNLFVITDYLRK